MFNKQERMRNENDGVVSDKENQSKDNINQNDARKTEDLVSIKSKSSTYQISSEKEEESMMLGMNSLPKETTERNDDDLKEMTASLLHFKEVNDMENRNNSARESKEGLITKMFSVDQLDKSENLSEKRSSLVNGTTREIKSTERIHNPTMTNSKRRLQRPFREIIGKREQRREELEKIENDLRQRLGVLECSIPAMMIWNIWKTAHGTPVCNIRRILEEQFKSVGEIPCRSTPSRHYDFRVRQTEAERKLALKKVEEARALWLEKVKTLEERRGKLEEARKIQEERKNTMERLHEEAKALQETTELCESCENEQCGDTQCKHRLFDKVSSVTSIESGDIQCLEQLQQLAEEEIALKRNIVELEQREEVYMRALQQADEIWSKMEGDTTSATSTLQEQLDMKTAANQQLADRVCELEDTLEDCRKKMALCRAELEKFTSIEKNETAIGRDDDIAKVTDREITADEIWSKMEGDTTSAMSTLQEQLDMKTAANQQLADRVCELEDTLENCRKKMALCKAELEKFTSIEKNETAIGRDDDIAKVTDREITVRARMVHRPIGRVDDIATVKDDGALTEIEVMDEETLAKSVLFDVETQTPAAPVKKDESVVAKPDLADIGINGQIDLIKMKEAETSVQLEDIVYEQQRLQEVREYLAKLDSLSELYKDDEPCPPGFVCNVVPSPIGMTDEELIALGIEPTIEMREKLNEKLLIKEEQLQKELTRETKDIDDDVEVKRKRIPDIETEKKTVEEAEERIIEVPDARARTIVKREITPEKDEQIVNHVVSVEFEDDSSVTMPNQIRTMEPKEIKVDQIKSEEPVEKDEIKFVAKAPMVPSKIDDVTKIEVESTTFPEIKRDDKVDIKRERELKINGEEIIIGAKLEDKLMVLEKEKEEKPEIESESIPLPHYEESPVAIASIRKVTESELLSDVTKTEIPTSMEPLKKDALRPVIKEDLEKTTIPLTEFTPTEVEIERVQIKKEIPNEEMITEETKDDETVRVVDKEKALIISEVEKEEKKISPDSVERIEKKVEDIPQEAVIEREIMLKAEIDTEKVLPIAEEIDEGKVAIDAIEKFEAEQVDEIKTADIEGKEIADIKKVTPILDVKRIEEPLMVEVPVDSTEVKEVKPISDDKEVDVKLPPIITDVAEEEQAEIKETPLISHLTDEKFEAPKPSAPITDIIKEEKVEMEQPSSIAIIIMAETVEPITKPSPTIERSEMVSEALPCVEIIKSMKKEHEEISSRITSFQPTEKGIVKEKEMLLVEKEEMLMKLTLPREPTVKKEVVKPSLIEVTEAKEKIVIAKIKSVEAVPTALPKMAIDQQSTTSPYLVVAEVDKSELFHIIPVTKLLRSHKAICCLRPLSTTQTAKPTEITQTDIVQTEIVQITAQTIESAGSRRPTTTLPQRITSGHLKPSMLKTNIEIADEPPEITGRKILWCERLTDQSTVATIDIGSEPSDKTSHISHDRVMRDKSDRRTMRVVPMDEILRSMKIAGPTRFDNTEREIRTINYSKRPDAMKKMTCNCCSCGRTTSPTSIKSRLEVQPQIGVKTTTMPPFEHVFIPRKIDRETVNGKLCTDCKAKITEKVLREKYCVENGIIKSPLGDQETYYDHTLRTGGLRHAVPPRKRTVEKRDQSCLIKLPTRGNNQRRRIDLQSLLERTRKSDVEPLSPSCICFKLGNSTAGSIKKGNCNCAD